MTQDRLEPYLERAREVGFNFIEVSDGTIEMQPAERRRAIARARNHGFAVITEVGKKDGATPLAPGAALAQIAADLDAGAVKVIVEGRESGTGAGVFNAAGMVKTDELEQIVAGLPDPTTLMWEAPLKSQQETLIARFGPNVNLGNIPPGEALALEALRRGLRGDTLRLARELVRAQPAGDGDR